MTMTTEETTTTTRPAPAEKPAPDRTPSAAKALTDGDAIARAATPTSLTRTVTTTAAPLEAASFRVYFADTAAPVPGELRIVVSAGRDVGADIPVSTIGDEAALRALLARAYLAATGAV